MAQNTSNKAAEQLKQRNALELEAQRWNYKKDELQYLEAGQHLRSLNQLMWQVPGMVIAITGGLWYGATTVESELPRTVVLLFAALFDILTILIIWRLRDLIEKHITLQRSFSSSTDSASKGKKTVIICWSAALIAAAVVGLVGAAFPSSLTKKPVIAPETRCCPVVQVISKEPEPRICRPPSVRRSTPKKDVLCPP